MEFGRFGFARSGSLLALFLVLLCRSEFQAWAQQASAPSPERPVPTLPTAQPISQAAVGSARTKADSGKAALGGASDSPVAVSDRSSSLRLGPGDLLEV